MCVAFFVLSAAALVPGAAALSTGAAASRLAHAAPPSPKERNAKLKAAIDAAEKQAEELEGQARAFRDELAPAGEDIAKATDDHTKEQAKLADEVAALRKERDEVAEKCNAEFREAHEALKKAVMKVHKKATQPLALSAHKHLTNFSNTAPEGGEEEDKMQYIDENKGLEKDLKAAKEEVDRQKVLVAKAKAAADRAKVRQKHWGRFLKASEGTYAAQKTALNKEMEIVKKKCIEAEDIRMGLEEKLKQLDAAGNTVEDARYEALYDWKYLENNREEELAGRDDGRSIKALQGNRETFDTAAMKCAKNEECSFFCWNPDDWTVYYPSRSQGYRRVGSYGAGWKCFGKRDKDTWTWAFENNAPTQELIGRDDSRAVQKLKGWKDSYEEAEAKCASEVSCNYFCWNPDDWSSYYPTRDQGYRHVGSYGAGWKCYAKHWDGDPKPEPLAKARLHTRRWHSTYWDGRCTVCPARWWRWKHCSHGGELIGEKGCGHWNWGCEGLCRTTHEVTYWVNR